jgi:hypothetical protein
MIFNNEIYDFVSEAGSIRKKPVYEADENQ